MESVRSRSSVAYLKPYKAALAAGVIALLVSNAVFLGVPYFQARAVQAFKDGHSDEVPMEIVWLMVAALATALTRIASRILIFNAARAAEYDLRSDLFGHLMTLSPGYYRDHPTGDVMSRLTNDVQTVRAMWGAGLVHLVERGDVVRDRADDDAHRSIRSSRCSSILPYPLIFIVGQALSKRIYRTTREVQAELGALSARIQEDLGAIQVIKTYGLEDVRRTGFVAGSQRLLDKNMDAAKVRIQLGPILNTLAPLAIAILILVGGRAVIHARHRRRRVHRVRDAARAARVADADARLHARARPARARVVVAARRSCRTRSPTSPTAPARALPVDRHEPARVEVKRPHDQDRRPRAARGPQLRARARHRHRDRRAHRRRQEHARRGAVPADRRAGRHDVRRRPRRHDDPARSRCARRSATRRRRRSCSRRRSPTTSRWATAAAPRSRRRARDELERVGAAAAAVDLSGEPRVVDARRRRPASRATSRRCPTGSRPSSASAASRCRAASASASRSPARSRRRRACSSSTTRCRRSTPRPSG